MRRYYAKIAGWAGLAVLLLTGMVYAVRAVADWTLWVPLALGLILSGWWLFEFKAEAKDVLSRRRTRQGANSLVFSLAVLCILVLVQAIAVSHDATWDLTAAKEHTLSDETVKAMQNLDQPVDVKAFFGPEGRESYEEMLRRVKLLNPSKFSYEFLNPNKEGLLAKELGVRSFGTSVVESGDKHESFSTTKEEDLLNAIVKVSSGVKKSVYVLTGHQEASMADVQQFGLASLSTALNNATFNTHELNLLSGAQVEVPEDAATVLVPGPRLDISKPELDAMTRYLARGGRIFVSLDPRQNTPGLQAWLAKAGVEMGNDVVIELNPMNQLMNLGPESALVQTFDKTHPATRDLAAQGGTAVFMLARTVSLAAKLPTGATGTVLAKSLPTAYGWRGAGNHPPNKPGPGDLKGPLDMMAGLESPASNFGGDLGAAKMARLVVIGNTSALGNAWMGNASTANQALFLNSMRWLADEEKRIALPPRPTENSPLMLDSGRASLIRWFIFLLLAGTLGTGIAVSRARKRTAL